MQKEFVYKNVSTIVPSYLWFTLCSFGYPRSVSVLKQVILLLMYPQEVVVA